MAEPDVLWANPAHWTIWGYHCKDDPRVIVPKRNPAMGWTMNWSQPMAVPVLVGMMAVATIPMLCVVGLGTLGTLGPLASILGALAAVPISILSIVGICRACSRVR